MNEARPPLFAGRYYFADPGRLRVAVESFIEDAAQVRLPNAPVGLLVPHGSLMQLGLLIGAAYKQTLFFPAQGRVALIVPTAAQDKALLCDPRPAYRTPLGELPVDHVSIQHLHASGAPITLGEDIEPIVETQALFILSAFGETPILPLRVPAGLPSDVELRLPGDVLVIVAANADGEVNLAQALERVALPQSPNALSRFLRSRQGHSPEQSALRLGLSAMRALGARHGRILLRAGDYVSGAVYP